MNIYFLLGKMPPGNAPFPQLLADMTEEQIFEEMKKAYPSYEISDELFGKLYKIILRHSNNFYCQIIKDKSNNRWLFSGCKFSSCKYKPQTKIDQKYVDTFEEIIQLINKN